MDISEYYASIINLFIFIIVISLFFANFSPKRTKGIANAYAAFALIMSCVSIGTIIWNYVKSPENSRNISLGYLVLFLINSVLGMITMYSLKYMKSLYTLGALLIGIVIYILYQLNTVGASIVKNTATASANASAFEEFLKSPGIFQDILKYLKLNNSQSFFEPLTYLPKLIQLKNAWMIPEEGTRWIYNLVVLLINWVGYIPKLGLYLIALLCWIFQFFLGGMYSSVIWFFNWVLSKGDVNPIKSEPVGFWVNMGEQMKKSISYSLWLCLFIFVIFILNTLQEQIRDKPISFMLAYTVIAFAFLGYIRFFKYELFDNYFLMAMVGLFVFGLYLYNPNNILQKLSGVNMLAIFLIFFYLVSIIFVYNYFPSIKAKTSDKTSASVVADLVDNYFGKIIVVIMSLSVSIALITFLVSTMGNPNNKSGAGVYFLNALIVIGMLTVAFNIIDSNKTIRNHPVFKLIISIILYIPCLLSDLADIMMSEYNKTKYFTLIIIAFEIVFAIIYWVLYPEVIRGLYTGGGNVLINSPVSLNKIRTIGYYRNLTGPYAEINAYKNSQVVKLNNSYSYGVSFWIYINPMPSYGDIYYSILNYGYNPNVMYNPKLNEFSIFMKSQNSNCSDISTTKFIDQIESVYTNLDFPLQKWTNIVLNYNGGRLDVFLNSVLVKTTTDVINCVRYDELTVGQSTGLNAKMCNLIYFNKPLDITTIHNMYNLTNIENTPQIPQKDLFAL